MAHDPKPAVARIRQFRGLMTNPDPHDLPPGAALVMDNVTTLVPGQLTVRKGHAETTFANEIADVASDIIAAWYFPTSLADFTVYVTASGLVKAGRNVTT